MGIKKSRAEADTSVAGTNCPGRTKSITKRLEKYAELKALNCQIGAALVRLEYEKLSDCLLRCGAYLVFRHYLATGEWKLSTGNFCNKHLVCPCCSAARSRRLLGKWLPVLFDGKGQRSRHYMLTLTWPPPGCVSGFAHASRTQQADSEETQLKANLAIGQRAWGKLWARRRNRRTGPLKHVLGVVLATEVTRGPAGWHPHFHCLVTLPINSRISAVELREEWFKLTGGRQIRLDPLKAETDVIEVFKYAVKPMDLDKQGVLKLSSVQDRLHVYQALRGARLVRGYGCYFNLEEPNLEDREELEDLGEWRELVFRWLRGEYQFMTERG